LHSQQSPDGLLESLHLVSVLEHGVDPQYEHWNEPQHAVSVTVENMPVFAKHASYVAIELISD
jgi:hypothetical protein